MKDFKQMSMLDIAYEYVKEQGKPVNFYDIYDYVCDAKALEEDEKNTRRSQFYTNVTIDGRFLTVGENKWDLRERHKFEDVHIDMNDIYAEEEDTEEDFDESLEDDGDSEEDSFDDSND